jgi:hypothetical protein
MDDRGAPVGRIAGIILALLIGALSLWLLAFGVWLGAVGGGA